MKKIYLSLFLALFVSVLPFNQADALKITLKRVVFEEGKRAEVMTLINSSAQPVTYRIGWKHYIMTEDESLVLIRENDGEVLPPEIKPVTEMVRFAPRRVTIQPNGSQQIRLMLRTPAGLEDGEYRSHLWIRPEPNVEAFREEAAKRLQDQGRKAGVTAKLLTGVTMPVIVRKGNLEASVQVENLVASETPGFVNASFYLRRDGNRSVYGDIEFICNNGEYSLRPMKGIAVYDEVPGRNFKVKVEKGSDQNACNTLTVQYFETDNFMGKERELLAEVSTSL